MTKKTLLPFFVTTAYLALFSLGLIEMVKWRGLVGSYFKLAYIFWVLLFLAGLLIKRFFTSPHIFHRQSWLKTVNNRYLLPMLILATIILFGLESWYYTNFVFSQLHLNHFVLIDLLILAFGTRLIFAPLPLLQKRWPVMMFFSFLLGAFYLSSYHQVLFDQMSSSIAGLTDDNFMEWTQVIVLAIGAVTSGILAIKNRTKPLLSLLYVLGIVAFVVLIGEEISWGQRIFSFAKNIRVNNYQQELNIHNQAGVNELTALLYIAAFIYGVISWQIHRLATHKKWIDDKFKPYWELGCFKGQEVLYLLPTFLFNPYADRSLFHGVPPILDLYYQWGLTPDFLKTLTFLATWRETFEVLFYAAFTIHVINLLREQQSH